MNYKELIEKTGLQIIGLCKGVEEYVKKETGKCYYSVDVEIKGTKMPVNIKLPEGYNKSHLKPFELVKLDCVIIPSFDRKGIQILATQNA